MTSGQIIIFHQPRFPWNIRGFPLQSPPFVGPKLVWGRELIWPDDIPSSPEASKLLNTPPSKPFSSSTSGVRTSRFAAKSGQFLFSTSKKRKDPRCTTSLGASCTIPIYIYIQYWVTMKNLVSYHFHIITVLIVMFHCFFLLLCCKL